MTTNPIATGGTAAAADATMVVGPVPTGAEAANSTTDNPVAALVDTVTLQGKDQSQAQAQAQAQTAKKDALWSESDRSGGRIGAVLFAYNSKGDLRIRFMDSANKLIYQTPPVMMARMEDLMMRSDSSVSAKV